MYFDLDADVRQAMTDKAMQSLLAIGRVLSTQKQSQREGRAMVNGYQYQIKVRRTEAGNIELFVHCANGYEPMMAITKSGAPLFDTEVRFSEFREGVFQILQNWATEGVTATAKGKAPCPHFGTIKTVFAAAQQRHLDTKNETAMRAALNRYLGRAADASRKAFEAADWALCARGIEAGEIAW